MQGIYAQVGGQSVIDPCYTITPPLPIDHRSMLHHYTSPCQSTIDPSYTITPHQFAQGMCPVSVMYIYALCISARAAKFGVVVFKASMLNWWGSICQVWCSSIQGIYAWLTGGPSAKFGVLVFKASMLDWLGGSICQVWCSGIQGIYAQLTGGPSAISIYVHSPICETYLV